MNPNRKSKLTTMRKRPWNRVNLPVYSIVSGVAEPNMNIATYVTAISMEPKRYVCGIYKNTQTLDNIVKDRRMLLQVLSHKQYTLVRLLGQQSGREVNKILRLKKRGLLSSWNNWPVLSGALALIELEVLQCIDAGDHFCFLCDVSRYKNLNEGSVLMLNELRNRKIIRG